MTWLTGLRLGEARGRIWYLHEGHLYSLSLDLGDPQALVGQWTEDSARAFLGLQREDEG